MQPGVDLFNSNVETNIKQHHFFTPEPMQSIKSGRGICRLPDNGYISQLASIEQLFAVKTVNAI